MLYMKQLFLDLEKACYDRLLSINKDIRLQRSKGITVDKLKIYRSDTDKLLSAIKSTTQFSEADYKVLRDKFLNPNMGASNDLQERKPYSVSG